MAKSSDAAPDAGSNRTALFVPSMASRGREPMGEVLVVMKIMPDSADRDLKKLEEDLTRVLPVGAKIQGYQIKPIAFGLKALICAVLVSDDAGGSEAVEHAFSMVEGVQSLEVEQVGRVF